MYTPPTDGEEVQKGKAALFLHELREAIRRIYLAETVDGGPDGGTSRARFGGVEKGVYGYITRALLNDRKSGLTGYLRGMLRNIIAGTVATKAALRMQVQVCHYCEGVVAGVTMGTGHGANSYVHGIGHRVRG